MPVGWVGQLAPSLFKEGHVMNMKLTSWGEFFEATAALLPVYAAFGAVILFLVLVLKLPGPSQGGRKRHRE